MRLARNTSPGANACPFRQTHSARSRSTVNAVPAIHQTISDSPLTSVDVKLFSLWLATREAHNTLRSRLLPYRSPGSPGKTRQQFLSGKPIRYYRPKGSAEV